MTNSALSARQALRLAPAVQFDPGLIRGCLDLEDKRDALFARTRRDGLTSLRAENRPAVNRVTGQVAESVAELLLDDMGFSVFWQITKDGLRGVDLLFLSQRQRVLALEVKGTLRARTVPRLMPSRLRQMSREWLNAPSNLGMVDWQLQADDLYAGVIAIDLSQAVTRSVLSVDFDTFLPVHSFSMIDESIG